MRKPKKSLFRERLLKLDGEELKPKSPGPPVEMEALNGSIHLTYQIQMRSNEKFLEYIDISVHDDAQHAITLASQHCTQL